MMLHSALVVALCFASASAQVGVRFGEPGQPEVGEKGLVADLLDQDPTGRGRFVGQQQQAPAGGYCCCTRSRTCPSGSGGGFTDFINPRDSLNADSTGPRFGGGLEGDIAVRIVNNPPTTSSQQTNGCPSNRRRCCYSSSSVVPRGSGCVPSSTGGNICSDRSTTGGAQRCGTRNPYPTPSAGGPQSQFGEFPWTCLVLERKNNDYVGTCAIVPSSRGNFDSRGTNRVITVAHRLNDIASSTALKVRVSEYDAARAARSEPVSHQEYTVNRISKHQNYNNVRLSYDVAVLTLSTTIQFNRYVNAACFPTSSTMFSGTFSNGTGTRCWVAGWGKNATSGSFQSVQTKVDVPLVPDNRCQTNLRNSGSGFRSFSLSQSEICAGGEEGKDACEGDGGAPLVCQHTDCRWYVVGLVAWGRDCAQRNVPGVYANVYDMLNFITGGR